MRKSDAKKLSPRSDFENDLLPARRKTVNLPDNLYFFEDELKNQGILKAKVITCTGWLLELLELKTGEIFFQTGEEEIFPGGKKLGIFYPPFSITRLCFKDVKGFLKGIAGTSELSEKFSKHPVVFETSFSASPENIEQVAEILASSRNVQIVDSYPKASLLSLRAKKLIDENYQIYPSISRIAARLNVSHEHLTRQFKCDFELSPNAYLHKLRIADATFRLSQGEKIIEVSGDVGYNDLSRFYKQFRKSTTKSPGYCQIALKTKND